MPRDVASDEPEIGDELPPLDTEGPPEEIEAEIDLTEFVDSFDGEPDVDLDDDRAPDLDVGVAVGEMDDESAAEDKNELVLDIAELLAISEDEDSAGDETGPLGFEPGLDVDELPEASGDTDEGSDDLLSGVVSEDLPSIDADEEGEASIEDGWAPDELLDEPLPPDAPAWSVRPLLTGDGIRSVVAERGLVVAAGSQIHCLGRDSRCVQARGAVVSIALVGGLLVYFTARGELYRQELGAEHAELLEDWRKAAHTRATSAISLELGGGGLEPGVLLARSSGGRLLRSRDRGSTFVAEDLHARVLAFDARAIPAVALVETGSGRSLITSSDGGSSWSALALDAEAARVASGAEPRVAAEGEVVALADLERSLAISADSGKTFFRVPGSARASALAIGGVDPHVLVWAALYDDTHDMTAIISIDVSSRATSVIARIGGDAAGARVEALTWDGSGRKLLAGGPFGLVEITPPGAG